MIARSLAQAGLSLLGGLCLLTLLAACLHRPHFPDNGRPAIWSVEEFHRLTDAAPGPGGPEIRLAGRIIRAERTAAGWTILSEWLPFPSSPYDGPGGPSPGKGNRYFVIFPGPIDEAGLDQGNEFLLTGRVTGFEDLTTRQGLRRRVPLLLADCFHVWKTAETDLLDFLTMDPLDDRYPPPLEDTYCVQ